MKQDAAIIEYLSLPAQRLLQFLFGQIKVKQFLSNLRLKIRQQVFGMTDCGKEIAAYTDQRCGDP